MNDSIRKKAPKHGAQPRKAYRSPVLSQYGDVKRLTRGTTGGGGDMGTAGPMTMTSCWIAEALYGVDTPRVLLVRAWLARCLDRRDGWALVVVPLYGRFGRRMAAAIRFFPALQRIFRPIFDRAVHRAYQEYSTQAIARRGRA
jgi:hypothetical protein